MIANAKIETVFTGFFSKRDSFFDKSEFEYKFIAMDKQGAIQNKKRIRRERRQERNRVETVEQKVERLRKIRERQRQKLVNETAQEKEIRLAKRRDNGLTD